VEPVTQLVVQARAEEVGLVDDEDGVIAPLGQVGEGVAQAFAQAAGVEVGADSES